MFYRIDTIPHMSFIVVPMLRTVSDSRVALLFAEASDSEMLVLLSYAILVTLPSVGKSV